MNFYVLIFFTFFFVIELSSSQNKFCSYCYSCNANSRYRTLDGTCNNLYKPWIGSRYTPLKRLLPPVYDNESGAARTLSVQKGTKLPNPRSVALEVHYPLEIEAEFTILGVLFGQMVTHDIVHAQPSNDFNNLTSVNCATMEQINNKECMFIKTPINDVINQDQPFMATERTGSLQMDCNCKKSTREQINSMTHWLDLSVIYGSSDTTNKLLRVYDDGLLKTSRIDLFSREFFPFAGPRACFSAPPRLCFVSGETRVNENVILTAIQTIWLREHNRIAQKLKQLRPRWNDEKLFQEARRLVIAEYQSIVYNEWLPIVLGQNLTEKYCIKCNRNEKLKLFSSNHMDVQIINEFSAAAFRFGHSMLKSLVLKKDKNYNLTDRILLQRIIFNATEAYRTGGLEAILRGTLGEKSNKCDCHFTDAIFDHLLEVPGRPVLVHRQSLVALTINRGRDHGLPSYNSYRKLCGLKVAKKFDDFDNIPRDVIERLKNVYAHVDDVDLYSGGVSENNIEDGLVGETFSCIIAMQFYELKFGDRFFFETVDSEFSELQLKQIRQIRFARILCDNMDIDEIYPSVFLPPSTQNRLVSCKNIYEMNFNSMFMYDTDF